MHHRIFNRKISYQNPVKVLLLRFNINPTKLSRKRAFSGSVNMKRKNAPIFQKKKIEHFSSIARDFKGKKLLLDPPPVNSNSYTKCLKVKIYGKWLDTKPLIINNINKFIIIYKNNFSLITYSDPKKCIPYTTDNYTNYNKVFWVSY